MNKKQKDKASEIALEALQTLNTFSLSKFIPIISKNKSIGWIHRSNYELISQKGLLIKEKNLDYLSLDLSEAKRFFENIYLEMIKLKIINNSVKEWCPVFYENSKQPRVNFSHHKIFGSNKLFDVQRSILGFFGFPAYGVHLNGWKEKGGKFYFLLAKRSKNLVKFPGLYDNFVAGGVVSNLSIIENLMKEAFEEAGIGSKRMKLVKQCSKISYCHLAKNYFCPSVIFIYDLKIADAEKFFNIDGEVEKFEFFNLEEIFEMVQQKKLKPNCIIPILDFIIRRNIDMFSKSSLNKIKNFLS